MAAETTISGHEKDSEDAPQERLVSYMNQELALPWQDYVPILLLLSWSASSIDVFSLPDLGVFVANNTGNLVLLSLAVGQLVPVYPDLVRPVPCIVSLVASWLGSYISGYLVRLRGGRNRGLLAFEFGSQAIVGVICAALYYGGQINPINSTKYIPIILLSMTMGQQNVVVKAMKTPPTIMTTVATGTMSDLFADPKLWHAHNQPRNERVGFVLTFFLGGAISAAAYRYSSPQLALLISSILKLLAAIGFLFARPKDSTALRKA